jgi:hypothetical protein
MSELNELKKIEADLLANKKKIEQAEAIEASKQAEAKVKQEAEMRKAQAKAFVARQELKNLEKTILKYVKVYVGKKQKHFSDEETAKWDAFLADLKGEKKPRKKRATKIEE